MPYDLNAADSLFGGRLLSWIDEEAAIYCACQMKVDRVVTKFISEIDFLSAAKLGDVLEIGLQVVAAGRSSLTLECMVRNKKPARPVISISQLVFVAVDETGRPVRHKYSGGRPSRIEHVEPKAFEADSNADLVPLNADLVSE